MVAPDWGRWEKTGNGNGSVSENIRLGARRGNPMSLLGIKTLDRIPKWQTKVFS